MTKRTLAFIAAVAICCSAYAVQQRLTLQDGRVISGDVTKTDTGYRLDTEMGSVEYPDSEVVAVEDIVSPIKLYQDRLAKIDPNSATDRFALGEFAIRNGLLREAAEQFREALRLKPDFEQASLMLQRVELQMARAASRPQTAPAATQPGYVGSYVPQEIKDEWLVSDKEINWIRLAELRPTDRVEVAISKDAIERFIAAKQGTGELRDLAGEQRFRGMTAMQKAVYILSRTSQSDVGLREGIRVQGNPQFMVDYRRLVWTVISRGCAAADCHGGDRAGGGLRLFRSDGRNDKIDYTNFVILDGYVAKGGKGRMIDRANPTRSLLLQFTLPEADAEFRHPTVAGFRVIFPNRRSPGYVNTLNWVKSLSGPMHPDYYLTYKPPFGMKLDLGASSSAFSGATSMPAAPAPVTPTPAVKRPGQ